MNARDIVRECLEHQEPFVFIGDKWLDATADAVMQSLTDAGFQVVKLQQVGWADEACDLIPLDAIAPGYDRPVYIKDATDE